MKRELGDIMWYWTTACASLGLDPFEVISENQKKLEARYGEKFELIEAKLGKKETYENSIAISRLNIND